MAAIVQILPVTSTNEPAIAPDASDDASTSDIPEGQAGQGQTATLRTTKLPVYSGVSGLEDAHHAEDKVRSKTVCEGSMVSYICAGLQSILSLSQDSDVRSDHLCRAPHC